MLLFELYARAKGAYLYSEITSEYSTLYLVTAEPLPESGEVGKGTICYLGTEPGSAESEFARRAGIPENTREFPYIEKGNSVPRVELEFGFYPKKGGELIPEYYAIVISYETVILE